MEELSQIVLVAGHEARVLRADRTLRAGLALLIALVVYGALNGRAWVRFQRRTLEAAAAEQSARLADLGARIGSIEAEPARPASPLDDPRSPATVGLTTGVRYATLPPGPLATMAIGQSDLLPYYVRVTTQGQQTFVNNDEIENPGHLLSGRCDLGFVVVALYPLVILALSYNLLSSEREGGTLALLLSQPVGLRAVVLGKVLLRAGVVTAVAVGVALVAYALGDSRSGSGAAVARWALWLGIVASYGAFWFAVALAVNALGRGSSANALILASAWLALVLVVPSLVNLAATSLYPVPSRVELIQATREAAIRVSEEGSKALAQYYEDHPDLASPGDAGIDDFLVRSYSAQEAVEREVEPVLARFESQLERQRTLVGRARFLSPAILAQEALEDVAGTGRARHARFLEQVAEFHSRWRSYFLPRIFRKAKLSTADLAELPGFAFREESESAVAARAAVGLLGILAPTAAVGVLGLRALRRYPIAG